MTEAELIVENLRLQLALDEILNCSDPRCVLCGRCLNLARPPQPAKPPPMIREDDPIRTTHHPEQGLDGRFKGKAIA